MGLDSVEIILRSEEFFAVAIEDHEASSVRTVGEFYQVICAKLNVTPLPSPATSAVLPIISEWQKTLLFLHKLTPLQPPPGVLPWSRQSVWDSLVAILVDKQGLRPEKIEYEARFAEDLGVD